MVQDATPADAALQGSLRGPLGAARFFGRGLVGAAAFWRQDRRVRVLRGVWERLWDGSRVVCRVPCLLVSYASSKACSSWTKGPGSLPIKRDRLS